jgi:dipeptidyl aminopeptidase/acylaminoacyl peptidase
MRTLLIQAFIILVTSTPLLSQDGTIIKREELDLMRDPDLAKRLFEFKNESWILKPEFSYLDNVVVEKIIYSSDGLKVTGYLAYPPIHDSLPVIIYNRGGNREFGALNSGKIAFILAKLASSGYLVIGSQYRGTDGSEGMEEFGGDDVHDVLSLIPLVESLPNADTGRMGIYGWSRGGMMTYLTLLRSDRFKAAVVGGGLTDLMMMKKSRPGMEEVYYDLIPGYGENKERSLHKRSAINFVEQLPPTTPILVLHGTSDWRVVPQMAIDFSEKLLQNRIPHRLVLFEGGDHGILEFRDEVDEMVLKWFNRFVKNGEPLPDMNPHGR